MIRNLYIVTFFFFSTTLLFGQEARLIADEVLAQQTTYWNKGDIPGFMETYWKSSELIFLGKEGYTKGWQQTLDRYHERYPNRQTMGQLTFTLDEVHQRSKKVISIIGQYHLEREGMENADGYFSLLMQKIKGKWLIVADSTH